MKAPFEADRIASELPDPIEGTSTEWLKIPPLLLSIFFGFGITYLSLRTDSLEFRDGDTLTPVTTPSQAEPSSSGPDLKAMGEKIYKRNCQACHQANGQGLANAFPPLDGSEWVQGEPRRLSAIVLHGLTGPIEVSGKSYSGTMPSFGEKLSEEEIAAVTTFIRGSWSNGAGAVSLAEVQESIALTKHKTEAWKGQDEIEKQTWTSP